MKNISVEIPRGGMSVELILRGGASSGQVVIVTSDDVEIRLSELELPSAPQRKTQPAANKDQLPAKAPARDLDSILKRLIKLKPTKRGAAVNSIKAMFQLTAPISDAAADKILEDLRRRGSLTIDANDKLKIRSV